MSTKASDKAQTEKPQKLKCGLIMPIAAIDGCTESHWEEVRNIIKEALSDTSFDVELVSDSNEIGIIQNRIVTNIYKSDIVICDVSGKNPNVMFELGMRLAFDKPTLIIKDDNTNYSFDTAPIEHIIYPRDLHYHSILAFKEVLKKKLLATHNASLDPNYTTFLKHFGDFRISEVTERTVNSETYILETLNKLAASVNHLQNTVSRPTQYSHFLPKTKNSLFNASKESISFEKALMSSWNMYKDLVNVSNKMLLDDNLRKDASLHMLFTLKENFPYPENTLMESINTFLLDIAIRAESNY